MPGINTHIGIRRIGLSGILGSSSYWNTLISATVEDAAPTHVVMTFSQSNNKFVASDFTIAGFTVLSGSWTGSVYTLVLSVAVVYGDSLTVVWKGTMSHAVTNNVLLPNILRYWKYDSIVQAGGLVSQLTDLMGNGNATQSNDTYKPLLESNYDNSPAGLRFGFAGRQYLDFSQISLTDFTIHMVVRCNGIGIVSTILGGDAAGANGSAVFGFGAYSVYLGTGAQDANSNQLITNSENLQLHVISIQNNKIYIDGVESTYVIDTPLTSLVISRIGHSTTPGNTNSYFEGFLYEIIIANTRHSRNDLFNYYFYARDKYGIKVPTVTHTWTADHVDYIKGNYQFGFTNNTIWFSNDKGVTRTTKSFADAYNITSSYIWDDGTVWFFTLATIYVSHDGLQSWTTITPKDRNGNNYIPHTPVNASYPGSYYAPYYAMSSCRWDINGVETLAWTNYGNYDYGANPTNIYFSNNSDSVVVTYQFGQSPVFRDNGAASPDPATGTLLGDATNPYTVRHGHSVGFDTVNLIFYAAFGDGTAAEVNANTNSLRWMKGVYDVGTGVIAWTQLAAYNNPTTRWKSVGIHVFGDYIYWGSDASSGSGEEVGIYKCKPADLLDVTKHEHYLFNDLPIAGSVPLKLVSAVIMHADGFGIATAFTQSDYGRHVVVTQNWWKNYTVYEVTDAAFNTYNRLMADGNDFYMYHVRPEWANNQTVIKLTVAKDTSSPKVISDGGTAPVISSVIVANATPNIVTITFDKEINLLKIPSTSSFSITNHTIASLSISSTGIAITCNENFAYQESSTISYSGTILEGWNNKQVATFSGQAITNNILSPPIVSTATVEDGAHANVVVTFDKNINTNYVPATTDFALAGKTINNVAIAGAVVTLTVSVAYVYGDSISLNYTKPESPESNYLRPALGVGYVASFSNQTVTNNIAQTDAGATAFLARAVNSSPSQAQINLVIKTFADLRSAGLLSILSMMNLEWINQTDNLLNWLSTNFNWTVTVSPTWVSKGGWTGNGSSQFINMNFPPNNAAPYAQNSACFGVEIVDVTGKTGCALGIYDSNASIITALNVASGVGYQRINQLAGALSDVLVTGYNCVNRLATPAFNLWKNATKVNGSGASIALTAYSPILLALNIQYDATVRPGSFGNYTIKKTWAGGGLSDQNWSDLMTILSYYSAHI